MKKGGKLFIFLLFVLVFSWTDHASAAYNSDCDSLVGLSENIIVLNDTQLEKIRGGLTVGGGTINIELPSQAGFFISITLPEITVSDTVPPVVTITPPIITLE